MRRKSKFPIPGFSESAGPLSSLIWSVVLCGLIGSSAVTARLAESAVVAGNCELRAGKLAPGLHTFIVQGIAADGGTILSHPVTVLVQVAPAGSTLQGPLIPAEGRPQ